MEILSTEVIGRGVTQTRNGERCWLAMHQRTFRDDQGKEHKYFFVTRGEKIVAPELKRPDAVVVIAFVGDGDDKRMVLTDEYRLPIDRREYGTPAGLIDAADYEGPPVVVNGEELSLIPSAAVRAGIREFHEETGLTLIPTEVSPDNMYCTAGMTDESICMVIGKASGTPSKEFLEAHEDIDTMMLNRDEIIELMKRKDVAFSKHVWPFLWTIKQFGFPE